MRVVTLLLFLQNFTLLFGESRERGEREFPILFWNIENFFDPKGDGGGEGWSRARFNLKRDGLAKVMIAAAGESTFPTFIGLAEIENRFVLNQLIYQTALYYAKYAILHKDSPDRRGIDVALLYRRELFKPLHTSWIEVELSNQKSGSYFSRDILYTKGVLMELDTLHLFINHWPSKFGGERKSTPNRVIAANALMRVCDSILDHFSKSNIIVMGDFNDTPNSIPIKRLKERLNLLQFKKNSLKIDGTIKYRGVWEAIDLIFVSDNLLDESEPISIERNSIQPFVKRYLLERDRAHLGVKPYRTFVGPRYNGGLSDHLPIVVKIKNNWQIF